MYLYRCKLKICLCSISDQSNHASSNDKERKTKVIIKIKREKPGIVIQIRGRYICDWLIISSDYFQSISYAPPPNHSHPNVRKSLRDKYKPTKALLVGPSDSTESISNHLESKKKRIASKANHTRSPTWRKSVGENSNHRSTKRKSIYWNDNDSTEKKGKKDTELRSKIAEITQKNVDLLHEMDGLADIIHLKDRNIAKKTDIISNLERLTMKFEKVIKHNADSKWRAKQEFEILKGKNSALKIEMDEQNQEVHDENIEIEKVKSAMLNLQKLKEGQTKQIEALQNELSKNKKAVTELKNKALKESVNTSAVESKLRKSLQRLNTNETEIVSLTEKITHLKESHGQSVVSRKMNKEKIEKIQNLRSEVKRLSINKDQMLRRSSMQADDFAKKILFLEMKLEDKEEGIVKLERRVADRRRKIDLLKEKNGYLEQMVQKFEEEASFTTDLEQNWEQKYIQSMADLKLVKKKNGEMRRRIHEQNVVIEKLRRKSTEKKQHEHMRSDAKLADKDNLIKQLQIEIIDKNIDLERFESDNDELLKRLDRQNENMHNKDMRLEEIKLTLDQILVERDRLIGETKEIKKRMRKFENLSNEKINIVL